MSRGEITTLRELKVGDRFTYTQKNPGKVFEVIKKSNLEVIVKQDRQHEVKGDINDEVRYLRNIND